MLKKNEVRDLILQDLLLSYNNQDSMILAKEETNGSREQNRETRNRPTQT